MTPTRGRTLLALLIAPGLLGACGDDHDEPAPGIANPASVYCVEHGGALEIERDQDGNERGICVVDGSRIDEWEYYRQSGQPATTDDG